jgi:hypothetical protein
MAAGEATAGIQEPPAGEAQHCERLLVAHGIARGGRPVGVRRLRDRRRDVRIPRRDAEDVTAGEREAPDRQLRRVDVRQAPGELDRRLPVRELLPNADDLTRLSPALP